jgi:SAM-dependent methyltransferase
MKKKRMLSMAIRGTIVLFAFMAALSPWGCQLFGQQATQGQGKPALDVPYEPTSYKITREMLNIANVTSTDMVYDLGCGDGRIVIMAAKERKARGIGVDLDPARIRESNENAKAAGVTHIVKFIEQNLFDTNISDATVVMLYLWPEVNLKLRPRLLKELKAGTRIVSHSHTMGDWKPESETRAQGHYLYFFIVPANSTGTWKLTGSDPNPASLRLTQKFQMVQGSMSAGSATYPVMNGRLRGSDIRFTVERVVHGVREIRLFEGAVSDNVMEGTIKDQTGNTVSTWKAIRDAATVVPIAE